MKRIVFLLIFLLFGCGYDKEIVINPVLHQKSIFEQIHLTVGLYKSPALITYQKAKENSWIFPPSTHTFLVGTGSSKLLNQTLSQMFGSIVTVSKEQLTSHAFEKKLAGVIDVDIESCDPVLAPFENISTKTIVYRFSIMDSMGVSIASWSVTGKYPGANSQICPKHPVSGIPFCNEREATESAMIDAMAKFIVDFYDNPDIQRWLKANRVVVNE